MGPLCGLPPQDPQARGLSQCVLVLQNTQPVLLKTIKVVRNKDIQKPSRPGGAEGDTAAAWQVGSWTGP